MTIPGHPALWKGKWTAEIIGPRAARMTSMKDTATGVQLVREYRLDEKSTRLTFTQTIRNVSAETKAYCHWSRTFTTGGGICLVPISPGSRFPRGFTIYRDGGLVIRPEDHANYRIRDNFLVIDGEPPQSKFGSIRGRLAGVCHETEPAVVKRFPVYRNAPIQSSPRSPSPSGTTRHDVRTRTHRPQRGHQTRGERLLHRGMATLSVHVSG